MIIFVLQFVLKKRQFRAKFYTRLSGLILFLIFSKEKKRKYSFYVYKNNDHYTNNDDTFILHNISIYCSTYATPKYLLQSLFLDYSRWKMKCKNAHREIVTFALIYNFPIERHYMQSKIYELRIAAALSMPYNLWSANYLSSRKFARCASLHSVLHYITLLFRTYWHFFLRFRSYIIAHLFILPLAVYKHPMTYELLLPFFLNYQYTLFFIFRSTRRFIGEKWLSTFDFLIFLLRCIYALYAALKRVETSIQ